MGNYDAQWNLTYLGIPGTPIKFTIARKDSNYDQNLTWNIALGSSSPFNGSGNYTLPAEEDILFLYFFDSAQFSDFVGGYASNGPPAAPENVQVTTVVSGGESFAKVTWNLSPEEDVSNFPYGTYQLWRRKKITNWENWSCIATTNGNVDSYTDYNIYGAGSGPYDVEYKLKAIDRTYHVSEFSSTVSLDWGNSMQKRGFVASNLEYNLIGNYPNPFNPQTKIRFSIKETGKVLLTVHDILGTHIATLIDEVKPQGKYEVTFDGGTLPSGTYIYRLTSNGFTSVKKMLLTK
ncbi:MAG: T9SS type A sorting domain-containing protein [Ignavibacteria bacterium]